MHDALPEGLARWASFHFGRRMFEYDTRPHCSRLREMSELESGEVPHGIAEWR